MKEYFHQAFEDPGLAGAVTAFKADVAALERRYPLVYSERRRQRFEQLFSGYREQIESLDFDHLGHAGKIDHLLFRNHLDRRRHDIHLEEVEQKRLEAVLPFGPSIVELIEQKMDLDFVEPESAANRLTELAKAIKEVEATDKLAADDRAVHWLEKLTEALGKWSEFYVGYDPGLDWWIRKPLQEVKEGLDKLSGDLKHIELGSFIPGSPIGREALEAEIALDLLPYSPEELIAIGEREYAWCLKEMLKASAELGFEDDWKAALEHVKDSALVPGEQPKMVRDLAVEAIAYVEQHNLLTIPELAKETWRMEMMSAERQKVSPFFLGGETIIVSYPTDTMTHEEKRMSMRGNNPNFSRATVQHELIPGHHMQFFMLQRHRPYRRLFNTPFWIEGWTLYWELLLWDLGFPRTPEERIGMLFWRMHRCVRISFSLRFHLGQLTTAECVDILVDQVGHERANAEGEVRRSFNGMYPPLYQAAYMIGGLQFKAISKELVGSGKMSYCEFHDAILRENEMPPAVMRMVLSGIEPKQNEMPRWRFDS